MNDANIIFLARTAAMNLRADGASQEDCRIAGLLERLSDALQVVADVDFENAYAYPIATGYNGIPLDADDVEVEQHDAAEAMNAVRTVQDMVQGIRHCGDCVRFGRNCNAASAELQACDRFAEATEKAEARHG